MMALDFRTIQTSSDSRYQKQIERVRISQGFVKSIENTVTSTLQNIDAGGRRLAIYGEPQSGKTEMMICLTAKLLDKGHNCVIILVNDSIDVLNQNFDRFLNSGLIPTPKSLTDLTQSVGLHKPKEQIILTKKNKDNLEALIDYLKRTNNTNRVIIDDEADHATPNAKINQKIDKKTGKANPQTAINKLVGDLLELKGDDTGIYIGVTATPQRLDLNNTFDNERQYWVLFDTHPNYHGHEIFFPQIENGVCKTTFHIEELPDDGDSPIFLEDALLRFMVNVAHLNCALPDIPGSGQQNYCMLVHTSGTKEDHKGDYKTVLRVFDEITQEKNSGEAGKYFQKLEQFAQKMFPNDVLNIMQYIYDKCEANIVNVINSERDRDLQKITSVTDPKRPFTVAIGGNIVSRGVTFNRLLTMFFTRRPHKIQIDTYVQRARMFGVRSPYLDHFELHIPKTLYRDWHRAFFYHRLGMASLRTGEPIWYEDSQTRAVAESSKDKANTNLDAGETEFQIFEFSTEIADLTHETLVGYRSFHELLQLLPKDYLPSQILRTVDSMKPNGDESIVVHKSRSIMTWTSLTSEDIELIKRGKKGLFYQSEADRFPKGVHHFQIFHNSSSKARMIYKYIEQGRGLRIVRWRKSN